MKHKSFRTWVSVSAIVLGVAVAAGAFGAHALKDKLDPYSISVYEKAVSYHFVHGLAMLALSLTGLSQALKEQDLEESFCGTLTWLLLGIVIFSGSLYLLALSGVKALGMITPLGGLLFIGAWARLAWATRASRLSSQP